MHLMQLIASNDLGIMKQLMCCSLSVNVDAGLMYFKLFMSAQLVDAYKEASRIVVSCQFSCW